MRPLSCLLAAATIVFGVAAGRAQSTAETAQPASGASQSQPPAQDAAGAPPKGYWSRTKLYGLFDANYSWNFNDPASKINTYRNFDYRANTGDINYSEFAIETPVEPIGFRADFGFGRATQLLYAAEPAPKAFRYIEQLYVSARPFKKYGLQLDFGKFVTSAGAEVIESNANWNYSRSLLFSWAIPYYHFGLRTTIPVNKYYTAGFQLVNGWNDVEDNNGAKTVGLTGALTVGKVSWFHNYYVGREKPDIDGVSQPGLRNLFDTSVLVAANTKTSIYVNFDYGTDKQVAGETAKWYGVAAAARYAVTNRLAFAPRIEWFKDRDGFSTGTPQSLREFTMTGEYKLWGYNGTAAMYTRVEYRRDWSNQGVFDRENGQLPHGTQNTMLVGLFITFTHGI